MAKSSYRIDFEVYLERKAALSISASMSTSMSISISNLIAVLSSIKSH